VNPRRSFAAILAALACILVPALALAQPPPERPWGVVILNDGDPTLPAFVAMDRAMRAALNAPGRHPVDIFSETLDMLRFPPAQFEAELLALMEKKYATMPVDAVVAIGAPSLAFAERYSARLWPQARIVFTGVAVEVLGKRRLGPNTTGFPRQDDLAGVADLALRLRPSTRRLVVISGSGEFDRMMALVARTQLEPHAKRLAIEYWQEAPMDEFLRRIAGLGRDDAVLYLGIGRDAEGRTFVPAEAMRPLSAASAAPVYGPLETYIGRGAVAGMVYSFDERGRRMGELVHEVLASRPAPVPPPIAAEPPSCMADARQLERFGLDASLLPPGCDIRFARPSLWREYRWHVLAALVVILAQAGLIVGLVWQRRGRVKAEGEVRHGRAELAQASRLALAGELIASIAHEINQPLGAILANAGAAEAILRRDPAASDELREILADIRKADLRASEVIRRVRALVTVRQSEREPVHVNTMIRGVLAFLRGESERRGVVVDTELASGLSALLVDRVQVQQAVVNLCINGMEAMADCTAGNRRLGVRTAPLDDGGVEISVSDSGPGIPREHLPQVFDSFFTTKAHGTGLGLSITRSIVEVHDGTVSAENRDEGGALFRMTLPVSAQVVQ
jgi:signal transduction histidine kinase